MLDIDECLTLMSVGHIAGSWTLKSIGIDECWTLMSVGL